MGYGLETGEAIFHDWCVNCLIMYDSVAISFSFECMPSMNFADSLHHAANFDRYRTARGNG